jgi:hypothetical protein
VSAAVRRFGAALAPVLAIAALLSAAPSHAGDSTPADCVDGSTQEARAVVSGDGGDGGPIFTEAFYRATLSIDVSTDGFTSRDLTISVEEVCDFPKALESQAVQLAGSDGVAVLTSRTRVYKGKRLLKGSRRTTEIDGADTMTLVVKLARPSHWRAGEDGAVPTFSTKRATITD